MGITVVWNHEVRNHRGLEFLWCGVTVVWSNRGVE
jgi:hypothetical protein